MSGWQDTRHWLLANSMMHDIPFEMYHRMTWFDQYKFDELPPEFFDFLAQEVIRHARKVQHELWTS